jgi:uncharacterized SAM-binding protein YcdF (DUF218 family)
LQPIDAILVLGGSIRREIHVAGLVKSSPNIPVLISSGSADPCIWLIFQREQSPIENVWLEKCAQSTFENFYYGVPILQAWEAQHVKLITSETHLPRALWLAKITLGSHGIWVDLDLASEQGIPGNRESWVKTTVDVGRGLIWAGVSQIIKPKCDRIVPLSKVDMATWQSSGFKCEHQGNLENQAPRSR